MTDNQSNNTTNNPKIPNTVQMADSLKPNAVATEESKPSIPAHIKGKQTVKSQTPNSQTPASQILDTDVRGQDLRTLAEARSNEAGRKWRKKAEANGEIQKEIGGPQGLEPTRYGDWEKAGRCFDF